MLFFTNKLLIPSLFFFFFRQNIEKGKNSNQSFNGMQDPEKLKLSIKPNNWPPR